jgi:HD-GYP domain-containing protein (c-di-GMP phosphodiesterase class II)
LIVGFFDDRRKAKFMPLTRSPESPIAQPRPFQDKARALNVILEDTFGTPFVFFDAASGELVFGDDYRPLGVPNASLTPAEVTAFAAAGQPHVAAVGPAHFQVSLVLCVSATPVLVATGVLPALSPPGPNRPIELTRLRNMVQAVSERLRLGDQLSVRSRTGHDLSAQVANALRANLTLGDAMRRLRVNQDEEKNRRRILSAVFRLMEVEALFWVPRRPDAAVLAEGNPLLAPEDCRRLAETLSHGASPSSEPLTCNEPGATPWGPHFPRVANVLAFHVLARDARGWVLAVNKKGGTGKVQAAPFRTSDAALLSPFVSLLELHLRAADHFKDLKGLLVGLARSLTAAIDAKDAYTAGHSERVARIAIELGRELRLEPDHLSDIYLAGLLHDVGKIGIRDEVLGKPGALTPEEYEHIKQHVTIGYRILQDLQPIRSLLPGVLYHHERYDGKGYPEGLAGERIPFLARLLAVADAYDAMSTKRPYRESMAPERVERILLEGAGTHWDPKVIQAFDRCKQRLHTICQRGVGESLRQAIDVALQTGDSSLLWTEAFPANGNGRQSAPFSK